MAQHEYDLPDDFDDYDDGAISQVRKAHKAAQRRIKELEQELTGFRVESRKRSVQEVLASRGFNPKIADLIPEDLNSEAEITSWLDDRSDVFQPTVAVNDGSPDDGQMGNQAEIQVPPGYQQFNEVVNAGQAPIGDESQIMAMIASAKTPEELNRIIFNNAAGPPVY